jgi:hypothetical protein
MMLDYSEALSRLKTGISNLGYLFLKRDRKEALNLINDMIVTLIELKQWLSKNENKFN